jgi:hypothetical protein
VSLAVNVVFGEEVVTDGTEPTITTELPAAP